MREHRIGLDIGTSAVRAAEVVVAPGRPPLLEAFGQVGLPSGVVVRGEVRDPAQVADALAVLWREGGFRGRRVRLALGGPRILVWEMVLPRRSPEEIAQAVSEYAERVVPFAPEVTQLASAVVRRLGEGTGTERVQLLVAAAHRAVLDAAVAALDGANLEPETIEVGAAALVRALCRRPGTPGSAPVREVVVTLGADLTVVAVHDGGTLRSLRTLDVGGSALTVAVGTRLGLGFDQAERAKRQATGAAVSDPSVLSALAFALEPIARHVRAAIDSCEAEPDRMPADRIVLSGGASRTAGVVAALTAATPRPVELGSPVLLLDTSGLELSGSRAEVVGSASGVSIGLTRSVPVDARVDLLPADVANRQARRRHRSSWRPLAVCVATVVALASLTAWRSGEVSSASKHVGALRATLRSIEETQLPREQEQARKRRTASAMQGEMAPLVDHGVDWLGVLNALGTAIPASATVASGEMTVSTKTGDDGARAPAAAGAGASQRDAGNTAIGRARLLVYVHTRAQVAEFAHALSAAEGFDHVKVAGPVRSTIAWVIFPVVLDVTESAAAARTNRTGG